MRALRVARLLRRAARRYDAGFLSVSRRALRLYRVDGFRLLEAAPLGLLDPRLPEATLDRFTSRKALRSIQARLNADGLAPLTEDKAVFYLFCRRLGLPIPALYALFYRGAAGWGDDGAVLTDRNAWRGLLERLPDEFVVKPARASLGLGVTLFHREGATFVDHLGREASADELLDRLERDPEHDAFVIQERLRNHPDLVRLSGSDTLQTARIHTFVAPGGDCRVLDASLKLAAGQAVVDNIQDGKTGNLVASISLGDGRLGQVVRESLESLACVSLVAHPVTGRSFDGVCVPGWTEACALARKAALEFVPLQSLGWDIAPTPRGPVIVEANMWWGPAPPNQVGTMPGILEALTRDDGAPGPASRR